MKLDRLITPIILGLSLLLYLTSCQNDSNKSENASEIESEYFDDYESPKYKWGFIDTNGEIVINPVYDDLKDFAGGLAATNFEGRWGYIDEKGKEAISFKYKQAYNFGDEGVTFVQDFENKWLLINISGNELDSLPYNELNSYTEGLAVFTDKGMKGLLDVQGKVVAAASYQSINVISNSVFIGRKYGSYSVMDIAGKKLTDNEYDRISSPQGGFFRAKKDGMYVFLDANSYKEIGPSKYKESFDFTYDNTVVRDENGYLLINKSMQPLKRLPYRKVKPLGYKRWKYKNDGQWGILSGDGDIITEEKYDLLHRYFDNRLAYGINDRWGYLDQNGVPIIGGDLALIWDFFDGRARMIGRRGVGFIDTSGRMVIPDIFFEVRDFHNGLARFQTF